MRPNRKARAPAGWRRRVRLVSATVLAAALVAIPVHASAADTATGGTEYVNAVTNSSLAHLKVTWTGWLVVPRDLPLWGTYYQARGTYGPYTATTTCSGFVASSTGDVVTAGHCVDADSYIGGKGAVLGAAMARWSDPQGNPLTNRERTRLTAILRSNADIEGTDSGSGPVRTIKVTVPALGPKARPASVVDVQPFRDGDAALLNVTGLTAPVLTVAEADPESGASIVAAGFSGSVNQIVDAKTAPSFNTGTASGTQTVNGTPFTQVSARTSPGMSGGPVVDMDGNVVGIVSWAPAGSNTSADFMTTTGNVRSILTGNGVDNTLTEADLSYRAGLTAYYEGRYHDAVTSFDEALAVHPNWRMVTQAKLKAVAKYPEEVVPEESTGTGFPTWAYFAIAGGVALVAAAGLGVYLMRRRGARPPTAAPVGPEGAIPPQPTAVPMPTVPEAEVMTTAPEPEVVATAPEPEVVATAPEPEVVTTTPTPEARVVPGPEDTATPPEATGRHVFCPNCGVKHDAAAHYCEECGQPLAAAMPDQHEIT